MTKYKFTIYSYSKCGKRTLKKVHHSSFTDNVRLVMKNVKGLRNQHKVFTVKFEKIV